MQPFHDLPSGVIVGTVDSEGVEWPAQGHGIVLEVLEVGGSWRRFLILSGKALLAENDSIGGASHIAEAAVAWLFGFLFCVLVFLEFDGWLRRRLRPLLGDKRE